MSKYDTFFTFLENAAEQGHEIRLVPMISKDGDVEFYAHHQDPYIFERAEQHVLSWRANIESRERETTMWSENVTAQKQQHCRGDAQIILEHFQ